MGSRKSAHVEANIRDGLVGEGGSVVRLSILVSSQHPKARGESVNLVIVRAVASWRTVGRRSGRRAREKKRLPDLGSRC